ncbi:two component LuxR family transcriptional regulator [Roseibium sp. TrichSKD4]|uniref:response regulator n=1 Tax=Roseibium sp. TrichSKD4 TaxID=744980 RepID=UPI0001E57378|nr:response regulator transcription factor [Roseibium sp. TrichSKD4]EFO28561.1 two component LuxR family transcriptional regulator [Roseibium sp. TrichSKD4]
MIEEQSKTRVLIVDSQPFVRQGIKACLNATDHCEVVGEAADGYAAILAAKTCRPQLVILEATITGMTTYETVKRLRKLDENMRILICFNSEDPFEIHELLQAGAGGVLQKSAEPTELINAVRAVAGGGSYLTGDLVNRVFSASSQSSTGVNLYGLTTRETEILRFVADGMSNKETANRLNLSVRTVETHRLNIRRKTKAYTLSDLVRVARRLRLVPSADPASSPDTDDTRFSAVPE